MKLQLPKNIDIGFYGYAREIGDARECFLTVASGELSRCGGSGNSRFAASLYRKNLYDLLIRKETEIRQVCFGDDSRGYWLFELFEPLTVPSPEEMETILHVCDGILPSAIIAGFGHPLPVTLDMVGLTKEGLKNLLSAYERTVTASNEKKLADCETVSPAKKN